MSESPFNRLHDGLRELADAARTGDFRKLRVTRVARCPICNTPARIENDTVNCLACNKRVVKAIKQERGNG